MKTVVFITGTNCSGKTSLARALIERFGGVAREEEPEEGVVYSVMKDRRVCFAGRYAGVKFGGVDWLNGTKMLPRLAEYALKEHDVLVCEGVYLNTFGPNLTSTMFQGDNRAIFFLYAPAETLHRRLIHRGGHPLTETIIRKQRQSLRAAKNFAQTGCLLYCFDTSTVATEEIAEHAYQYIIGKCGK